MDHTGSPDGVCRRRGSHIKVHLWCTVKRMHNTVKWCTDSLHKTLSYRSTCSLQMEWCCRDSLHCYMLFTTLFKTNSPLQRACMTYMLFVKVNWTLYVHTGLTTPYLYTSYTHIRIITTTYKAWLGAIEWLARLIPHLYIWLTSDNRFQKVFSRVTPSHTPRK